MNFIYLALLLGGVYIVVHTWRRERAARKVVATKLETVVDHFPPDMGETLVQRQKHQRAADVSDCTSGADLLMQIVDALDTREGDVGQTYLVDAHPIKDRCITIASRLERLAGRLRKNA